LRAEAVGSDCSTIGFRLRRKEAFRKNPDEVDVRILLAS